MLMIQELFDDNNALLQILNQTYKSAVSEENEGIANFVAERLDAHNKHAWQLRSFLKGSRA